MKWTWTCVSFALAALVFCEFGADFVVLSQCEWPVGAQNDTKVLKAVILADTHLLGPIRGHWLDKLYREWHMYRSFQAAMYLHQPDVVFVLGDLFDEGEYVDAKEFGYYVNRFLRYFQTPVGVPLISAAGNHDIGFHHRFHPYLSERFEQHFRNTGVGWYTLKGVHFVFINSMAMEDDGCHFCEEAKQQLADVKDKLNCLKDLERCKDKKLIAQRGNYSRPVLMQHFPTYRISDRVCRQVDDTPEYYRYREKWDVLSKAATDSLGQLLAPRVAFAGHSHNFCLNKNRMGIEEYTVASFSWRNKINPSFLLATFTPQDYAVIKCDMLPQEVVYNIYFAAAVLCCSISVWKIFRYCGRTIRTLPSDVVRKR